MKQITADNFSAYLKTARIRSRLQRELRLPPTIDDWMNRDFLAVMTRSGNEGVLCIDFDAVTATLPFTLKRGLVDTRTGRTKPIICDLCYTWQKGGNAGSITFACADARSVTFLCCADLACSLHVRNKTPAAALSRSQLHEDMTTEQRISRLHQKLQAVIARVSTTQ